MNQLILKNQVVLMSLAVEVIANYLAPKTPDDATALTHLGVVLAAQCEETEAALAAWKPGEGE